MEICGIFEVSELDDYNKLTFKEGFDKFGPWNLIIHQCMDGFKTVNENLKTAVELMSIEKP